MHGYSNIGDLDQALAWMKRGWELGDRWEHFYMRAYSNPGLVALRAHSEYQALVDDTIGSTQSCHGHGEMF